MNRNARIALLFSAAILTLITAHAKSNHPAQYAEYRYCALGP